VRAALAISALLFAVVVIALLFNIFNGDPTTSSTTVVADPGVSTTVAELREIDILDVECSIEAIGAFVCDNLISGTDAEYQFNYEDVPEGQAITINLIFDQPIVVQRIDWVNLEDVTKLKRNYRARGIVVNAESNLQPIPLQLEDLPGSQPIAFAAIDTNSILITIESDYPAEVVDDNVFSEMAIQEIRVIGRPAITGTTNPTGTTSTTVGETTSSTTGSTTASTTTTP
jgi:hypothetical protein